MKPSHLDCKTSSGQGVGGLLLINESTLGRGGVATGRSPPTVGGENSTPRWLELRWISHEVGVRPNETTGPIFVHQPEGTWQSLFQKNQRSAVHSASSNRWTQSAAFSSGAPIESFNPWQLPFMIFIKLRFFPT